MTTFKPRDIIQNIDTPKQRYVVIEPDRDGFLVKTLLDDNTLGQEYIIMRLTAFECVDRWDGEDTQHIVLDISLDAYTALGGEETIRKIAMKAINKIMAF